jgi:hypothetical protein
MSLIDEATSGAEALMDGAGDVAMTLASDVAFQSAELAADVTVRALDVAADTAEEAVEVVRRVGLRRLLALGAVVVILLAIAKVMKGSTSSPGPVDTTFTPRSDADPAEVDVVDLSSS